MNGEEVLKLIDAGFTAEEVRKMQTETASQSTDSQGVEGSQSQEHESEVDEGDKSKDINTDFMDSITKAVSDLTDKVKAIQENNVKTAKQEPTKDLSAEDVIKSFVESM